MVVMQRSRVVESGLTDQVLDDPQHPTPSSLSLRYCSHEPSILQMKGVAKRFTLHHQNGIELPVLGNVDLAVSPGECVVLDGPSGMGKSTLLKMIYANYRATEGSITVRSATGALVDVTRPRPVRWCNCAGTPSAT